MINILICAIAITVWISAVVGVIVIMSDIDDEFDLFDAMIKYHELQIRCIDGRHN